MPKTYGTVTTFTAGSVLTASQLNVASTAVNNLVVPAACQVRRTTDQTSFTSGAAVTWSNSAYDTDGMFTSGTTVTINTAGLYLVTGLLFVQATATLTQTFLGFRKNGSNVGQTYTSAYSSTANTLMGSMVLNLAVNDTIGMTADFTGGSAYIVRGSASEDNTQTRMTVTWIGRTT